MSQHTEILSTEQFQEAATLVRGVWASNEFPGAWQSIPKDDQERAAHDAQAMDITGRVLHGVASQFMQVIAEGLPDKPRVEQEQNLRDVVKKAVAFSAALPRGQITDVETLSAMGLAIGSMYLADQTMDGGDTVMPQVALHRYGGSNIAAYDHVDARFSILDRIPGYIGRYALPDDAEQVFDCFGRQVLLHEAMAHQMSREYESLDHSARKDYLEENGEVIAEHLIVDAGFPSVSSSLHAVYRSAQPELDLPDLEYVHNHSEIKKLLRLSNAVVRIVDDLGDMEVDAGKYPDHGIFSLNVFNQAHPRVLGLFMELAGIGPSNQKRFVDSFKIYRDDTYNRRNIGQTIKSLLKDRTERYFSNLEDRMGDEFSTYFELCKRVHVIGQINAAGDPDLAIQAK